MRVLILGATGMLGHRLLPVLAARFDTLGTIRGDVNSLQRTWPLARQVAIQGGVFAEDFDGIVAVFAAFRPHAAINCIGIVKQLPAAKDPVLNIAINALFPHRLAQLCRASGARLIHISTDCVFSGTKGEPYTENDVPDPTDLYGRTKLLGEVAGAGCLTLRTSMIGRELRGRSSLLEWFLGNRQGQVEGFTRALYTGLTTPVLAQLIGRLVERHPELDGVWHVAADPISKFDLLRLVNRAFETQTTIHPNTTFICDRRLVGRRFCEATGFRAPDWADMVAELAADRESYGGPG